MDDRGGEVNEGSDMAAKYTLDAIIGFVLEA